MMWTARLLAAISVVSLSVPGAAQTAPPPAAEGESGSAIVVTGKKESPPPRSIYDQARELSRVGRNRKELYEESLPRFKAPLCPGAFGLKADFAEMMIDRIRANAARLRIPLAKPECSPNLIVAFVDDGRSLLSGLEQSQPQMFKLMMASERTELLAEEAPVRVWNNISTEWTEGRPPPGWRDGQGPPSIRGQLNRTALPSRLDIRSALVVFDRRAVSGMTLVQLADYATMRGLSHTRAASGEQPMATILALFEQPSRGPDALTRFDVGYLRSLYFSRANIPAVHKLLDIRRLAEAEQGEK